MTKIALLGAGGKMGVRLATNLKGSRFTVDHVELSDVGRKRLKDEAGLDCVDQDTALKGCDVVVLAVPDRLIGEITRGIIDKLRPGTAVIALDAAAPHCGEMPKRDDVTYFVTHPCHPSIFGAETTEAAQKDYFGGVAAPQAIVCCLMQGPEEHYALCEEVSKTIFKPVSRSHRVTLENMAVLEPALSETVGATLCQALKDACDEAVKMGVPKEAAYDFMLGHLKIELSIIFGFYPGRFSDGAIMAIKEATPRLFKQGWLQDVFNEKSIAESTRAIVFPKA